MKSRTWQQLVGALLGLLIWSCDSLLSNDSNELSTQWVASFLELPSGGTNSTSARARFTLQVDYIEQLRGNPDYVGIQYGWRLERYRDQSTEWSLVDSLYYPVYQSYEDGIDTISITYTPSEETFIHGRLTLVVAPSTDNAGWGYSYTHSPDDHMVSYYYVIPTESQIAEVES